MKRIVIIEGPAGSGKSTLAKAVETGSGILGIPVTLVSSSLKTRTLTEPEGSIRSAANDYSKLVQAVAEPGPVVVDRMFSQYVYWQLRRGRVACSPGELIDRYQSLLAMAAVELLWRNPDLGIMNRGLDYKTMWVFALPDTETLSRYRESGQKGYPWKPERELELYRSWATSLAQETESRNDATFLVRTVDTGDQREYRETLLSISSFLAGSPATPKPLSLRAKGK